MVLPQDSRGPNRQQRWVECINVGATEIPPYGVVQVAGSIRLDAVRTIIQVKRPECDGHCNVMVNGLITIPVGEYGVCTNDFPAYALYSGATPAVSETWGSRASSYFLKKNQRVFIIVGDVDATNTIVRVNKNPNADILAEANLDEELCGAAQSSVAVVNAKLLPSCVEFTPDSVTNRRFHRGKDGARIVMMKRQCGSQDPCGCEETWDIIDIELQAYCPVTYIDDRPSCLVYAGLKVGGEWCTADQPTVACAAVMYIDCSGTLADCDLSLTFDPLYACCSQGSGT